MFSAKRYRETWSPSNYWGTTPPPWPSGPQAQSGSLVHSGPKGWTDFSLQDCIGQLRPIRWVDFFKGWVVALPKRALLTSERPVGFFPRRYSRAPGYPSGICPRRTRSRLVRQVRYPSRWMDRCSLCLPWTVCSPVPYWTLRRLARP